MLGGGIAGCVHEHLLTVSPDLGPRELPQQTVRLFELTWSNVRVGVSALCFRLAHCFTATNTDITGDQVQNLVMLCYHTLSFPPSLPPSISQDPCTLSPSKKRQKEGRRFFNRLWHPFGQCRKINDLVSFQSSPVKYAPLLRTTNSSFHSNLLDFTKRIKIYPHVLIQSFYKYGSLAKKKKKIYENKHEAILLVGFKSTVSRWWWCKWRTLKQKLTVHRSKRIVLTMNLHRRAQIWRGLFINRTLLFSHPQKNVTSN